MVVSSRGGTNRRPSEKACSQCSTEITDCKLKCCKVIDGLDYHRFILGDPWKAESTLGHTQVRVIQCISYALGIAIKAPKTVIQGCKLGSRKKSEIIHKTFSDNPNLSSTCVKSALKMKFKR